MTDFISKITYFTEMNNRSALYYIETQLIELALKQGDISRAGRLIANATPGVHIDANMINIRNQYLEHYYERTGDYRRAYEYLKRDVALNDSIRNERVRTRVAELDMRYRQDTIVMRRELVIAHPALPLTCFWFWASYFLICKIVINTHAPFQGCWENYVR